MGSRSKSRGARLARGALVVVLVVLGALLAAPACVSVPLAPDRPELDHFVDARPTSAVVEVTPLLMGKATQLECGMVGEASCFRTVQEIQGAYLVRHPQGTFLIDSGISTHFNDDVNRFAWFLRPALKVETTDNTKHALSAVGVERPDFVILTHVHWDHTSGLVELPGEKVLTTEEDLEFMRSFKSGRRTGQPIVMPEHFGNAVPTTIRWEGPAYENFPRSHDVFGDGAVVMVPLPGHTPGAVGVFVNGVHGRRLFFVGDAVWNRDGYRIPSHRPGPMTKLVDQDRASTSDTDWRLYHLAKKRPELVIVPAHDGAAMDDVRALAGGK